MQWTDLLPFTNLGGVDSPLRFGGMLVGSVAVDLAIALWILLRGAPGRITSLRVVVAATAVLATVPFEAVLLRPLGLGKFGLIHMLWHDVTIVAPVTALVVLLAARSRSTAVVRAIAWGTLVLWPVAGYARFVEPLQLRTEAVDVPVRAIAAGESPLRVLVLADLQTDEVTAYERHVFDVIEAASPDLILIPGDVFQGCGRRFDEVKDELSALLARLDAPGGVWFVPGDVDLGFQVRELLAGTRIRTLENEIAEVRVDGRTVALCGLGRFVGTEEARRAIDRFLERDDPSELRIVFAHHPHAIDLLPPSAPVDLTVGGHTHGGQVVVPGFGPPITLCPLPRGMAAGGLHERNGNLLYVSRGVGHERGQAPRIRFLAPPEISLLTLDPRGDGDL